MKHFIILFFALFATGVNAGNVTVPNTFTAGTSALASEVNTNFNALATGINNNDTAINNMSGTVSANSLAIGSVQSGVNANTTAIATKADQTALTSLSGEVVTNTLAIAGKADVSSVQANTTALANKADASLGTDVTANSMAITDLQNRPVAKSLRVSARDENSVLRDIGTFISYTAESFLTYMSDKGFQQKIYSGVGSVETKLIVQNEAPIYFDNTSCDTTGIMWAKVNIKQVFSSSNQLFYSMYVKKSGLNAPSAPLGLLVNGTCFQNPANPSGLHRIVYLNNQTITGINGNLFGNAIVGYK